MLLLPTDSQIKYIGHNPNVVTVIATYRIKYEDYIRAEGDYYLHIKDKGDGCDMVCPMCGAPL